MMDRDTGLGVARSSAGDRRRSPRPGLVDSGVLNLTAYAPWGPDPLHKSSRSLHARVRVAAPCGLLAWMFDDKPVVSRLSAVARSGERW